MPSSCKLLNPDRVGKACATPPTSERRKSSSQYVVGMAKPTGQPGRKNVQRKDRAAEDVQRAGGRLADEALVPDDEQGHARQQQSHLLPRIL